VTQWNRRGPWRFGGLGHRAPDRGPQADHDSVDLRRKPPSRRGTVPVLASRGRPVGRASWTARSFTSSAPTRYFYCRPLPLVTVNVERVLGIDDRKRSVAPGKDADIVFLTEGTMVDTVMARGGS
jgi:hypothetical protein